MCLEEFYSFITFTQHKENERNPRKYGFLSKEMRNAIFEKLDAIDRFGDTVNLAIDFNFCSIIASKDEISSLVTNDNEFSPVTSCYDSEKISSFSVS